MAEFEMKCPHCGTQLTVQDDWAGMDVECPSCKKSFKIDLKPGKLPDPKKAKVLAKDNSSRSSGKLPDPKKAKDSAENSSSRSSESAENSSKGNDDPPGLGVVVFILAAIALVVWLLWLFVTGLPRLAFWLIASLFWIIYAAAGGTKLKWLTMILLAGTITWGWLAHTGTSSSGSGRTSYSSYDSGNDSNLSFKARVGRRILDRLPASQRDYLLTGSGSYDDQANALANLSTDELDAVTAYLSERK